MVWLGLMIEMSFLRVLLLVDFCLAASRPSNRREHGLSVGREKNKREIGRVTIVCVCCSGVEGQNREQKIARRVSVQ